MSDQELEDASYHPAGVPLTPQARRFGYEFPVWVSKAVWKTHCVAQGIKSKHRVTTEGRIMRLLQFCYEGMTRRLTQSDDFVFYYFKIWFWDRNRPEARKQARARLGARLFIDPETGGPWMYIFWPNVDSIDTLEKGEAPAAEPYDPMVHFDPAPGECE